MAKFKVGDSVKYIGALYGSLTGKVGVISSIQQTNDYMVQFGSNSGPGWFMSDHELELDVPGGFLAPASFIPFTPAVPLPSEGLLAGFGQTVPPYHSVTPKAIEPVCPSCGCKDARNYVGFSSVECANYRCRHYKELVNG